MNTMTPARPTLGEGVSFESEIPLSWQPLDQPLTETRLVSLNRENLGILQSMQFIDEYFPGQVDESDQLDADLARIEFKLNLLMDLFGRWLQANTLMPEPKWMLMNSQGVEWSEPADTEIGSIGILSLYLEPKYPGAIRLYSQVVNRAIGVDGTVHVTVRFQGVAAKVQDWLDKIVFRFHRRSIAYRKTNF